MRTYRIKNPPVTKTYAQRWAKNNLKRSSGTTPKLISNPVTKSKKK